MTEVIAVEPEPYLRAQATRNAVRAPVPVRVVDALAERMPLKDASMGAAVVGLVLCSVPNQQAA